MNDILFNVQQAVLETLSSSADIQALLGTPPRIYDHVPPGAAFPYVAVGPIHIVPDDAKTDKGFEQIATLNIFSRYRGGKETRAIFQAIYDALHRATLTVAGQAFTACDFHSADFSLEPDGLTYAAAARFSIATKD